MRDLLAFALELREHGFAPLPIRADGTKAPAVNWKGFIATGEMPTEDEIEKWFSTIDTDGLGLITGRSSDHLEMIEFESRATHLQESLGALMSDNGFGPLWARIINGWAEMTPSGGIHYHYRISDGPAAPSAKLARNSEREVMIETRGQGGFTVIAPSAGRSHASGKGWIPLIGSFLTCPSITCAERDALFAISTMLDEAPPIAMLPPSEKRERKEGDSLRPGDDFNARATWSEILGKHGWIELRSFGNGYKSWQRSGGWPGGLSATTGLNDGDNLYVFSTSTVFETQVPISKFAAYTILEHGGDFAAAASALASQGYGARKEELRASYNDFSDLVGESFGALAIQPAPIEQASPAPHLTLVEPQTYSETDDGNALRLVDRYDKAIHYCPQRGSWLVWDSHKWAWDEDGKVYELARHIARTLPERDKESAKHRKNSLSRRSIEAMVKLAEHDKRTVVHLSKLDAKPYELNTPAGVLDLRTASLRPSDPLSLHTRSTNVAPDFDAVPTQWLNFLADTFAGDVALTTYIQRLLGVSLIGTVLEQLLPFGFGSGANGKTTLVGVVQRIVGIGDGGYSISAPADMLVASNHQGHPTEIARLAGARLVIASELEDGQHFAEAKIKQLTGRDTISGRFMRQDWFSFTPTHTLWLLANFQPAVRAGGPAFWRRLRLLPFLHTVPAESRIADLEDRLVEREGPAILAWLAQGAADYLALGLAEPESVSVATDAYQTDQDTVGRFVKECCVVSKPGSQGFSVRITTLRQAYETWCRVEGETPVSAKALTMSLRSRFEIISERTMSERFYSGVRLETLEEPVMEDPSSKIDDEDDWRLK